MKITSCRRLGWALLGTVLASSAIDAGTAPAKQFQRSAVHGIVHSKILPAVVDRTPVNVVVILPGDSVADAQATAGRRLTRQEKNAIKAQRAAEQAVKRGQIEGAGGRVTGAFQSALNGVKVTIPRNQLGELRQLPGVVDVVRVGLHKPLNVVSVPRIQAPIAWSGAAGVRGEGIKIGIIDTGIDYTHADFGGTGTPGPTRRHLRPIRHRPTRLCSAPVHPRSREVPTWSAMITTPIRNPPAFSRYPIPIPTRWIAIPTGRMLPARPPATESWRTVRLSTVPTTS